MAENFPIPDFAKMAQLFFEGLAPDIGMLAKGFFRGSFYNGGFTDNGLTLWPQTKDEDGHRTLIRSHALMDSIVVSKATADEVQVSAGDNLPYAEIHNNGGTIMVNVTAKSRRFFWYMYKKTEDEKWKWMALTKKSRLSIRIPQRQFIGDSATLNKQIDKYIMDKIIKAQAAVMPR